MTDLWVLDSTDDAADFRLLTAAEFAHIATAEGYVKVDDPQVVAEWTITDEVDEDDLRAQGYVKLDGIDVERVRSGSSLLRQCIRPIDGRARELLNDTLDTLDLVLAAIHPQDPPT